jgi:hypothetical protein
MPRMARPARCAWLGWDGGDGTSSGMGGARPWQPMPPWQEPVRPATARDADCSLAWIGRAAYNGHKWMPG